MKENKTIKQKIFIFILFAFTSFICIVLFFNKFKGRSEEIDASVINTDNQKISLHEEVNNDNKNLKEDVALNNKKELDYPEEGNSIGETNPSQEKEPGFVDRIIDTILTYSSKGEESSAGSEINIAEAGSGSSDSTYSSPVLNKSDQIPGNGKQEENINKDTEDKEDNTENNKDDFSNTLDLKTIEKYDLYYKGTKVDELDITAGLPQNTTGYYAMVGGNGLPEMYLNVKDFRKVGNELEVLLDSDSFVKYQLVDNVLTKTKGISIFVPYKENGLSNGILPASDFLEKIQKDLAGEYVLECDLDASSLNGDFAVPGNFTGTLHGNGYRIYNLSMPLFENISGGKVNNVTISNASVTDNKGILASSIKNGGVVANVCIENSRINSPNLSQVGGMVGVLDNGKIEDCILTGLSVAANNTLGGIAGQINANGSVINSLVEGNLNGTLSHGNLGTRVGGITGWHSGSIDKCSVNVTVSAPAAHGNGGLIGGPKQLGGSMSDSYCLVKGKAYQVSGFDVSLGNASNIYASTIGTALENVSESVSNQNHSEALIKDTLGMSDTIWNYWKTFDSPFSEESMIQYVPGYSNSNAIAYGNISKLAPFLNIEDIVLYGNTLSHEGLRTKRISEIIPYDTNKALATHINEGGDGISKISVLYQDGSFEHFDVSFNTILSSLVWTGTINSINIPYHFNKYIVQDGSDLEAYILSKASGLDYTSDIASTTTEDEVRQYIDHYNNEIKDGLALFAKKLVATRYPQSLYNEYLLAEAKDEIDKELTKILYTYSYFKKWYDFNVGTLNVADFLFFEGRKLDDSLTIDYLISSLYNGNRGINQAYNHYNSTIAQKTGKELYDQLEWLMDLAGYTDYNQWFLEEFKGIIVEVEPIGFTKEPVLYRVWDNMKKLTGNNSHLLHFLNIPEEEQINIGILSGPSQLMITDTHVYYAQSDETARQKLKNSLNNYAQSLGKYYGTSLYFVNNGVNYVNNTVCTSYDSIQGFASNKYPGRQLQGAEEPMVKWIIEPLGKFYAKNAAAVAGGNNLYFGVTKMLTDFSLFTHENAHNQDRSYFYGGQQRRQYSDGEFHVEGLLADPGVYDGGMSFNLITDYGITQNVVTNMKRSRIYSTELLQDFYADIFDSWYAFNAMYGNALLSATDTVKSNVSNKVNLLGLDSNPSATNSDTQYAYGYWDTDFALMNLQSIEDLYTRRIAIRSGVGSVGSSYDLDFFWNVHFFEPSNPNGVADPGTFKRLSQELLGYKGYENGFLPWVTNQYANDEAAIKGITGYNSMKEYKLARYNEALGKLDDIPYFNSRQIEEVIGAVFKTETRTGHKHNSLAIKKILFGAVKRVTEDFLNGTIYEASSNMYKVSTPQELIDLVNDNCIDKGIHIILTQDLDFSSVPLEGESYAGRLIGFLDGAGYTITGLKKPLFEDMRFGVVSNIIFEGDSDIYLAKKAGYSLAHHCNLDSGKQLIEIKEAYAVEYVLNTLQKKTVTRMLGTVSENSISANDLSVSENSISGF